MNDLSRIVDEMCAWFDGVEPASAPTLPTSEDQRGNRQASDLKHISHTSRTSYAENEHLGLSDLMAVEALCFSAEGSRVTSSCAAGVGSAGSVGSEAKTPAGSAPFPFPQDLKNVGSVGRESDFREQPFPDQSHPAPPLGDPLPITPADVCAGVARELRHLADLGVTGPEAERRAVEITRAKVGNSPALAGQQLNAGRCAVCDGPMGESEAVVAVLNPGGAPLHLHAACHETHRARRRALVDKIMRSAGYGTEATEDAA